MQLLTLDEAIYLEDKYSYLTGWETKFGKIKTLIRQPHEEDANYYKVIVIVLYPSEQPHLVCKFNSI